MFIIAFLSVLRTPARMLALPRPNALPAPLLRIQAACHACYACRIGYWPRLGLRRVAGAQRRFAGAGWLLLALARMW